MNWLDNAILEYIENNSNVDSIDIHIHFKLHADLIMASLQRLQESSKIIRIYQGINAWYIPKKPKN